MTNLASSYNKVTGFMDGRRTVDVMYLNFNKAFDTVFYGTLINKLRKYGLDKTVGGEGECTES